SWRRHLDRDSLPRRITTAPSNFIWLGRYFPMAPEGLIQLHQERLGYFFWKLWVKRLRQHSITAYQLSRLAEATVMKTLSHEAFHHRSDLVRLLHGDNSPRYCPLVEEALAVASSWHHVRRQGRAWDMPEALWDGFLTEAYRYTAPGYRDWEGCRGSNFFSGFQNHVLSPRAIAVLGRHGRCETTTWEMARRYRMMQQIFGLDPGRFDLEDGFDWYLPHRLGDRYGFFAPDYSMTYLESGRVYVEVVVSGGRVIREYS
ncbi:MAG: hypothetical protein KJ558_09055, partial [Gammaproteobacteria bacterium]|nr:hypothetical protein [Gammaproteobacteria bacterium]